MMKTVVLQRWGVLVCSGMLLGMAVRAPRVCAQDLTAKKVYSGAAIKLTDGRKIRYIGLSVPDKKSKPFFEFCREANRALVAHRTLTIQTDLMRKLPNDKKLLAYVYAGKTFINAALIRQGYALVHIVPPNTQHQERFLALQAEARAKRRGLWAYEDGGSEPYYIGSKRERAFHRPECFHSKNIEFDDRARFRTKEEALERGYVQDWRCSPLFKEPEQAAE